MVAQVQRVCVLLFGNNLLKDHTKTLFEAVSLLIGHVKTIQGRFSKKKGQFILIYIPVYIIIISAADCHRAPRYIDDFFLKKLPSVDINSPYDQSHLIASVNS